jgi:glycosyltransferase involved in cell wall biosynthesis
LLTRHEGQRRKILLLIKGLGLGGAERLLVDALSFVDRTRFDYHVAYLLPWKNFLVTDLERFGIPVHCLGDMAGSPDKLFRGPTGSPAAVRLLPRALRQLLRLHRREKFDLVQADLPLAGILARLVGRWMRVPIVYTEHNLQERYHSLTRWVNAATYGWNRRVLAVSTEVAASIERSGLSQRTRVVTLPNGVPIESIRSESADGPSLRGELDIPQDHLVVGTVAVFRTQKRLEDWLQVAARVAERRTDVTFLLVGSGPLEPTIRARIDALGLARRVRAPGFRPDGRRLMAVMDVYLMTSEFEGLPMALLEAMALGKPAVSTAVGGVPEVLEHGVSGLLTPIGAIDQLSAGVLQLLENPTLRQQMGQRAMRKVESEYHVRRRIAAIENLYREVLEEPSPAHGSRLKAHATTLSPKP